VNKRFHQAILVSCEVPWDDREQLIEDMFRHEVRQTLARGFNDLYIFGTAGEGYAVDRRRFEQIAAIFREETSAPGVHPQVGVIGLSTALVLERLSFAHDQGFRTFQISLPCWGALNDDELLRFFSDVCGTFPDARFLHYNLARAKRVLTPLDYRRLADSVPNLAATKNTGTTVNTTAALVTGTPELQHFFGEAMFPAGCLHGECSLLSSFAPMIPSKTKQFFEFGRTRQIDKLFEMQKEYLTMVEDVIAPMRRRELMDGAYDKLLVRLGGCPMPPRLLSPYDSFSEEVFQECRTIFEERYPQWAG
jgi:dihydrodipicolinate synthase/N-acetylneuraminate lyase